MFFVFILIQTESYLAVERIEKAKIKNTDLKLQSYFDAFALNEFTLSHFQVRLFRFIKVNNAPFLLIL
ncbi:MAG: hypothetical protein ACI97N_002590, partial [Cognaticolwellia sp.]